jgi:DNA-binding SARP family transcriptional activator
VGLRQQRLIAALALLGERPRQFLSGLLWPDSSEAQASGNLRAALFKISHQLPGLLDDRTEPVGLSGSVTVDLHEFRSHLAGAGGAGSADLPADFTDVLRSAELLPGWYDDWVLFEQERLREQRVLVLESLSRRHLLDEDTERALDAARSAAAIEPLRESAQRLLIEVQLRAGNAAGARRTFIDFEARLWEELGVEPSDGLRSLLGPVAMATVRKITTAEPAEPGRSRAARPDPRPRPRLSPIAMRPA